jgi:hypothetical protein
MRPKNTCTTILSYHKKQVPAATKKPKEKIESIETLETCMAWKKDPV